MQLVIQEAMFTLSQVFEHRSLAFDVGHLCTFETSETWINKLFEAAQRAVSKGFHRGDSRTLGQLVVADREHFVWLADRLEGHLQKPIGAERPMDAAFCELSDSHHADLSGGGPRGRGNRLAAHSFKATLITWSGWCPVPTFTLLEQQLMGHHVRRAREPGWTASLESDPFTLPPP